MAEITKEYLKTLLDQQSHGIFARFDLFEERLLAIETSVDELQQSMSIRFSFADKELYEIKRELKDFSKRDIEDSNALAKSITKLQKRIEILETQVKKLKSKESAKV